MDTYYVHIMNWEIEATSPEAAVIEAIRRLSEPDGPLDFAWRVTEDEAGMDRVSERKCQTFETEGWFYPGELHPK